MKLFFLHLFCAFVFSIGLTGSFKSLQASPGKIASNPSVKKAPLYLSSTQKSTSSQQMTAIKTKKAGGVAFTCPAAKWSGLKSDFYYHFTLTHITTQDPRIVKLVRKAIKAHITTHIPLNNGHHSVSWIQPGTQGINSLFFKGEAADFKLNLHDHLMQDSIISPYVSPYIAAHVDVKGNFSKKLYKTFTVDQIIERKTP